MNAYLIKDQVHANQEKKKEKKLESCFWGTPLQSKEENFFLIRRIIIFMISLCSDHQLLIGYPEISDCPEMMKKFPFSVHK